MRPMKIFRLLTGLIVVSSMSIFCGPVSASATSLDDLKKLEIICLVAATFAFSALRRLTRVHSRSVEQPVNLDDGQRRDNDEGQWGLPAKSLRPLHRRNRGRPRSQQRGQQQAPDQELTFRPTGPRENTAAEALQASSKQRHQREAHADHREHDEDPGVRVAAHQCESADEYGGQCQQAPDQGTDSGRFWIEPRWGFGGHRGTQSAVYARARALHRIALPTCSLFATTTRRAAGPCSHGG